MKVLHPKVHHDQRYPMLLVRDESSHKKENELNNISNKLL